MRFDRWINEGPITLGMHLPLQTFPSKPIAPDRLYCSENFDLMGTIPERSPHLSQKNSYKVRFRDTDSDNILTAFVLYSHVIISRGGPRRDMSYLPVFILTVALIQGILCLLSTLKFFYLSKRLRTPHTTPVSLPPITIIVPCKGLDPGFRDNMRAFLNLQYPNFQLIFVFENTSDPAFEEVQSLCSQFKRSLCITTIAGPAQGRGQKVHNLLHALKRVRPEDKIILFGDSDIRPRSDWARALVINLDDPKIGLTTGFRWYLPVQGGIFSKLRSAWNGGVLSILDPDNAIFAWGGAMACPLHVLGASEMKKIWEGALSDDFTISDAVRSKGYKIRFVPLALSFSFEDCSFRELWRWSHRQISITRIYNPSLWALSWIGPIFFVSSIILGLYRSTLAPDQQGSSGILSLTLIIVCLSAFQITLRRAAISHLFPEYRSQLDPHLGLFDLFSGFFASLLTLIGLARSICTRVIEWRGILYRMDSSRKTTIL